MYEKSIFKWHKAGEKSMFRQQVAIYFIVKKGWSYVSARVQSRATSMAQVRIRIRTYVYSMMKYYLLQLHHFTQCI